MQSALLPWALTLAHTAAFVIIAIRVVMRKPAIGVALAWLLLVGSIPVAGVLFYLLVGERRVGQRRARRIARLRTDYSRLTARIVNKSLRQVDWSSHRPEAPAMDRLGETLVGVPTVAGSTLRLLTDSSEILRAIAADIDRAETSVLMEFYIWQEGGLADGVVESLIKAAGRSVSCRVMVDAVGSGQWWRGEQPARLRQAGVKVRRAFPAGIWQAIVSRNDLRLHRKIIVIDDAVAWTGSMNLVDPRFFKQDCDVGQWVDAMVRAEGAVVAPLAMIVVGDWIVESGESLNDVLDSTLLNGVAPNGKAAIQVIPSGPEESGDAALQMLLALVNSAQHELVLTTPYFVPDESLLRALRGAAGRGVEVHLILPKRVDSLLIRHACQSYLEELMELGVTVHRFGEGLLHTKSITSDQSISMFGSMNLDMRSIWLNYEVSLFVYDEAFGACLRELQQSYMDQSELLDLVEWRKRPLREKLMENTLRLMSPVL
jgi:cardiolipin synthase